MRLPKIEIPKITPEQKSPVVSQLLEISEQQSVLLQRLVEENQFLRDEIARLKSHKPKPKIPPSELEKDFQKEEESDGKRSTPPPGQLRETKRRT